MLKRVLKNENGSALVIAIIVAALTIVLGSAFVIATTGEGIRTVNHEQETQAHYNARSGVNIAHTWLRTEDGSKWIEKGIKKWDVNGMEGHLKNYVDKDIEYESLLGKPIEGLIADSVDIIVGIKLQQRTVSGEEYRDGVDRLVTEVVVESTGKYKNQNHEIIGRTTLHTYPELGKRSESSSPDPGGVRLWVKGAFNDMIDEAMFTGDSKLSQGTKEVNKSNNDVLEIELSDDPKEFLVGNEYNKVEINEKGEEIFKGVFTGTNKDSKRVFKKRLLIEAPDDLIIAKRASVTRTIFEQDVIVNNSGPGQDVKLKDATFKGNVYITAEEVHEIQNCIFEKDVYIETKKGKDGHLTDISGNTFNGNFYADIDENFHLNGDGENIFNGLVYVKAEQIQTHGITNKFNNHVYFEATGSGSSSISQIKKDTFGGELILKGDFGNTEKSDSLNNALSSFKDHSDGLISKSIKEFSYEPSVGEVSDSEEKADPYEVDYETFVKMLRNNLLERIGPNTEWSTR